MEIVTRRLHGEDMDLVLAARRLFGSRLEPHAVTAFLASDRDHLLMAFLDGDAAGFLRAHELARLDGPPKMLLYDLETDPRYRRRGVARALVDALKHVARDRGARSIFVLTNAANEAAMKLYAATGATRPSDDDVVWVYGTATTSISTRPTNGLAGRGRRPRTTRRTAMSGSTASIVERPDLHVLACRAEAFPAGISGAWQRLESTILDHRGRRFFGVSVPGPGGLVYYAAFERREGDEPGVGAACLEPLTVPGGRFARVRVADWQERRGEIAGIFDELIASFDIRADGIAIEYYRSDSELHLMVPLAG